MRPGPSEVNPEPEQTDLELPNMGFGDREDAAEPALILALFDGVNGIRFKPQGPAPPSVRIFTELLTALPTKHRDGRLFRMTFPIREIVTEWLCWRRDGYRPKGPQTGRALVKAIQEVRDGFLTINERGGGYFPIVFEAATGWGLQDRISFLVQIGANSAFYWCPVTRAWPL